MKFVLIHGSWHNGSAWDQVRRYLEAEGHEVHTPTVGGFALGCNKLEFQTMDSAIAPVVSYIKEHDLKDFVLVGHSYGGPIITQVTRQVPDRIKSLVFQNAFVPLEGYTMRQMVPQPYIEAVEPLVKESKDNSVTLPFQVFKSVFINDGDDKLVEEVYATLTSQPWGQWGDELPMADFFKLNIEKAYIRAAQDLSCGPNGWDHHPPRLGKFKLVEMEGSHEVMFTNPELLAEKIIEAAEGKGETFDGEMKSFMV